MTKTDVYVIAFVLVATLLVHTRYVGFRRALTVFWKDAVPLLLGYVTARGV